MHGMNSDIVITQPPVTKFVHKKLYHEWIEGILEDMELRALSQHVSRADSTSTMYFAMTNVNTPSMHPEQEAKVSPGWKIDFTEMNRECVYAWTRFPRETSIIREPWPKNVVDLVGFTPRTTLGKRLLEIRNRLIASGERLLNWEEIDAEVAARRGETTE